MRRIEKILGANFAQISRLMWSGVYAMGVPQPGRLWHPRILMLVFRTEGSSSARKFQGFGPNTFVSWAQAEQYILSRC